MSQSVVSTATNILDHIVHLTPPGTLDDSVQAFRDLGFTVSPGGTHADGQTANALVVFADGTYLELLHFTRAPPSSSTHPWAHKPPGWIDYAFLGNAGTPSIAHTINSRADADGSGARYAQEVRGGRKREDGKVLEWLISATAEDGERGKLPFFCGDLTPREWRVPLEPHSNTEHANTAKGVSHVRLLAAADELDALTKKLTSVVGASPRESTPSRVIWDLGQQPSRRDDPPKLPVLILSTPQDDEESEHVRTHGRGIYEFGVAVAVPREAGQTPYGRVVYKTV
ncbi:glyoxalase-like domain-containing protein [Trametes elegans]|nr:glyoxalase-like domain-containing protein [Trametes elegans]